MGIISLLFLSFYLIGGCDVDFGNSNNGGGGGGGNTNMETIQGTVAKIIPDQNIDGITVSISIDNSVPVTDVTNASGVFSLDGSFAGNAKITFTDTNSNSLGTAFINVFPTAQVDLGDITLDSGTVDFQGQTQVTFDGKVTSNNCSGNTGSLETDAKNSEGTTTVIVQVSASTDLLDRNGNAITCDNISLATSLQVQGVITSGNTVNASRIQVN
jgi:hypothetical protein